MSLPLFQFLLLRWYFRLFIWARFLWQVSRIELSLMPTASGPRRRPGLPRRRRPARSRRCCWPRGRCWPGLMANRIFYAGATLPAVQGGADRAGGRDGVRRARAAARVHVRSSRPPSAPACASTACWRSATCSEYDRKWLRGGAPPDEPLLGSADIQSLADLGNSFDVVKEMRWVPFTLSTVLQLAVTTLAACAAADVDDDLARGVSRPPAQGRILARLVVFGWITTCCGRVWAQGVETSDIPSIEPAPGTVESTAEEGSGVTPLVAPLPFRNSQIGWGVALMLGLIHRLDSDTTVKPSTGAIVGLASENGSWGVMAMEMARLGRDSWRARGVAGYMDLQYDFYGIGIDAGEAGQSVPIEQTFFVASGALLRRVATGLYLGGQVVWLTTTVTPQGSAGPNQPTLPDQANTELLAGGLQAEFDTRDDDYWPQRGSLAQLKGNFFTTTTGESGSFQRYQAAWSWYHGFKGPRLVLATNLLACGAPGDAPF